MHPALPVASVKDLVHLARTKPGTLSYASSGIGTLNHLSFELLKSRLGIDLVHVPYKGSTPKLADLAAGRVDSAFESMSTSLPHMQAGRLKALAVSGEARSPLATELPTLAEAGFPGFSYSNYFALVAPAGTPAAVTERLSREIARVVSSNEVRNRLQNLGLEASSLAAADLDALIRKERSVWAAVVDAAQIRIE